MLCDHNTYCLLYKIERYGYSTEFQVEKTSDQLEVSELATHCQIGAMPLWLTCGFAPQAFVRTRNDVLRYSPPQWMRQYTGLRKFNVILIGEAGAGKTAFVSTIASICRKHIKQYGEEDSAPRLLKWLFPPKFFKSYEFKTDEGRETTFRIFDTVGWRDRDPDYLQLRNLITGTAPQRANWMRSILAPNENNDGVPKLENRMHSIVFVVPVRSVQNDRHMAQIKNLTDIVFLLGMGSKEYHSLPRQSRNWWKST